MRNRVKKYYGRNLKSIDDLLKDIEGRQEALLDNHDLLLSELQGKTLNERGADTLKLLTFMRHYITKDKSIIKDLPPLNNLIETLQALDRLQKTPPEKDIIAERDPKLARFLDTLLENIFKAEIAELGGATRGFLDEQMSYREEFFNRRNELPKGNACRRIFIEQYIDEEVFNRFYLEKEKEAGRYETENEGEAYTPEGAKQWDEYFNQLCDEYGEPEYKRIYDDPTEYYPTVTQKDKLYSMNYVNWANGIMKELETLEKGLNYEKQS